MSEPATKTSAYRAEALITLYRAAKAKGVESLTVSADGKVKLALGSLTEAEFVEKALDEGGLRDWDECPIEVFQQVTADALPGRYNNLLRFDLNEAAIHGLAEEVIHRTGATADLVVAIPHAERTFANTLQALETNDQICSALSSSVDFMSSVHADKAIRDASSEADKKMSAFSVKHWMRLDIYEAVVALSETEEAKSLAPEDARLLERTLRDLRRRGLHLDAEKRKRLEEIKSEMSDLGIEFAKNLGEENTKLAFTREELDGIPEDLINSLDKVEDDDTKLYLELKYPHYFPAVQRCKVVSTRQQMERAFNQRCMGPNTVIIERLVELRAEQASILDFPSHAAYVLDVRMAKSPEKVKAFLDELEDKLKPLASKEMEELLALKKEEMEERGEQFDGVIHPYDFRYYLRMREERKYEVDQEALRPYFPLHVVLKGVLEFYEELLGLKFTEVTDEDKKHVWHEDVRFYEVHDGASGDFIGQFYLDLHPREGKYGHAACFGLQPSCSMVSNGVTVKQYPAPALVCNFTKPTKEKPSLLDHDEVVTTLHEFGHCLHGLCSDIGHHVTFAGTRVERDFVEAPSQMLENWGWEKDILLRMCGHHEDGSKIPDAMLDKLVAARNANAGLLNQRQLVFAFLDQELHQTDKADTAAVYASNLKRIMGLEATPDTNFVANFGHLAGGYDASYYGYLWSEVYSASMYYERFKVEGILNKETGASYRREILAPGGSRDGMDSLVAFLGHEPSMDSFLRSKGLIE